MQEKFSLQVGYDSSHYVASIAAVAMGARIIEKHFTLNKKLPGPDHKASLSINQLKALIKDIRYLECALGYGIKPNTEEKK